MRKGRAEFPLSYFFVLVMDWDSSTGNIQCFFQKLLSVYLGKCMRFSFV